MTYFGKRISLTFHFACGCERKVGPIYEKFAYQYGRLGRKQWCKDHTALEVSRTVRLADNPPEPTMSPEEQAEAKRLYEEVTQHSDR